MVDDSLLWDTARDLYATPLPEFIGTRNDRVRALRTDGHDPVARQVSAFKKPSAGADAVNRLIRHDERLADDIAELGARLRAAQADPVATELRALDQERRALVVRARSAARQLDAALTAASLDHVEQTVWAALVDAQAAAAVLAGVLVRPLSPGGFGEVDTTDASAVPVEASQAAPPRRQRTRSAGTAPTKDDAAEAARAKKEAARARKEAEAALAEAQEANGRAQDDLAAATRSADEAVERRDDLEQERDELRARLTEVEQSLREAKTQVTETTSALHDAERRRRSAAADVDRAVERLG